MSKRLLVNPGTPQAWKIELRPGLNRLGSGDSNDFIINHPSIATHHCELTVTDTAVWLTNLEASNGTFVERVAVTEFQLQPGHQVQLGSVNMIFEASGLPDLPDAVNLPGDGARIVVANPGPGAPPPPPIPAGTRRNIPSETTPPEPLPEISIRRSSYQAPATPEQRAFQRGVIGASLSGLGGMIGWYLLVKVAESDSDWFAWGVGAVTALGGSFLARQGSQRLGIICGGVALLASLGGIYLGAQQSESFKANLSLFTCLWLFLGVITAYKIGASPKD